jgi:predicted ATP-grasp superfamily ATP-dependent carboligase
MRLLLSDGSGLTSRQVATLAHRAGHTVEVLSPTVLGPARFTRHVRRVHRVPAFGVDPFAWLDAAVAVLERGSFDVFLPTQEQVTLLAAAPDRIAATGAALPVPPFAALRRVQDKVAQARTLSDLHLPHPPTTLAHDAAEVRTADTPCFVKTAIGTASTGVHRADDRAELDTIAAALTADGAFADGPVVVQQPAPGPLAMVQAVYDRGRLVAWHANLREREGANGGASAKRSIALPAALDDLRTLGTALDWHGALSLDAILTPDGLRWIDINPRLVEPGNAAAAGVDLVGALIAVARDEHPVPQPAGAPGVRTHQLLLTVLGAAQRSGRRRAVLRELANAGAHHGPYRGSTEELTPTAGDPLAAVPVAIAAALTLARPRAYRLLTDGAVSAYALSPAGWRAITATRPDSTPAPPAPSPSPRVRRAA